MEATTCIDYPLQLQKQPQQSLLFTTPLGCYCDHTPYSSVQPQLTTLIALGTNIYVGGFTQRAPDVN